MGNINIQIPDELHEKAKYKALERKITLGEFVIDSIKDNVR